MRYADPNLCPDCRSDLPRGADACPTCGLTVRHPLAVELFRTLHRADELVEELRVVGAPAVAVPATPPPPPPPPVPYGGAPVPAAPAVPAPQRAGVGLAWVPKLLLGAGALFLLVAAITFLAVAWSHLGVGGRTAVLLALTAVTGTAALLLHRSELRIAGEALIVVALGLLALDVVGAGTAGWFGDLSDGAVALATGVALLLAGAGAGTLRINAQPRLVAPQVVAAIGLLAATAGSYDVTAHDLVAGHVWVVVGGAGALLARRLGLPVLAWGLALAGALVWAIGALLGLAVSVDRPDVHQLWVDGSGWSLLVSSALLVVPGVVLKHRTLLQAGGSVAALLVTATLAVPCIDTTIGTTELVTLLITLGWTLALALLPRVLRPVAIAPALIGAVGLALFVLTTVAIDLARWAAAVDRDASSSRTAFAGTDPVTEPLLTVPAVLVVLAVLALLPSAAPVQRAWPTWIAAGGVLTGLGAAATLASYDAPVVAAVAILAATGAAAAVLAVARRGAGQDGFAFTGLLVVAAAVVGGCPWPAAAALALAVATGTTTMLHLLSRTDGVRTLAGGLLPLSLAGLLEAVGPLVELDVAWRGVPVVVAVGLLAIARPRPAVEAGAALGGALCVVPAVAAAADPAGSLALHLTVAGCLVSATALIHETRRHAAWAGAALLLLASWVRLADLGISAPEPYTLPLAAALIAAGAWRMRLSTEASSFATLTPGLLLATVPSLAWVLDEPTWLRATLLGLGAVAITVGGSVLRWSAPLVIGAAVGAAVVLRELGPYAGDAPAWVWMGLGGALLVVVGITWERRLLEVRNAVGLLGRLR